jgi:hypothetical protein
MRHEFDQSSLNALSKIPIKGVFYRTGHFSYPLNQPRFSTLAKSSGFLKKFRNLKTFQEIHLAYSFGNSGLDPFVRKYLNDRPAKATQWISERIIEDFSLYRSLNPRVVGIQIDLEGVGIDFDVYGRLLERLREGIPKVLISITPMSSWIKRKGFKALSSHVDLLVPMLYDFQRSRVANAPLKVTDLHWLEKMVKLYDQAGKPVIYGLPTYSYCIVYDESGKMRLSWALISPDSVTQNPRLSKAQMTYNESKGPLKLTRTRDRVLTFEVEEKLKFSNLAFGKGSRVKYNFLSPSSVAQYLTAIENTPSQWGRGVGFFRFGVPGEALVLDAWRLKEAVRQSFGTKVKVQAEVFFVSATEFFLAFTNLGRPTYFGKTGYQLSLPGKVDAPLHSRGDFDRVLRIKENQSTKLILEEDYFDRREMLISPLLKLNGAGKTPLPIKITFERSDGITVPLNWEIQRDEETRILTR